MEIRKDLKSAELFLNRLLEYSYVFRKYNTQNWSHLKNREDFDRIYKLPLEQRTDLERVYGTGRDISVYMSSQLQSFNYADLYPTLTSFIDSFNDSWLIELESLKNISEKAKITAQALKSCPWAVDQMIRLFDEQLELLKAVKATLNQMKTTDIFKIENGIEIMKENKGIVYNIGDISAGRVNLSSTDNSINFSDVSFDKFFDDISDALKNEISEKEKLDVILDELNDLKASINTPLYKQKYNDFIQAAANHMTIVGPFIPALSKLLG
jgi:predicted DNA-binding protein YlxM (UPF0122 family)